MAASTFQIEQQIQRLQREVDRLSGVKRNISKQEERGPINMGGSKISNMSKGTRGSDAATVEQITGVGDASFITVALSGNLTTERKLTAGTGITLTDGGANGNLTIDATTSGDEARRYALLVG